MSLKYYGIYIAYPPTVDLRVEGLGRHLAVFLKAAAQRTDVRFVVACPSWSRETMLELCESEGVDPDTFDLISPAGKPVVLTVFEAYKTYLTRRKRRNWYTRLKTHIQLLGTTHRHWLETKFAQTRNMFVFVLTASYLLLLILLTTPFAFLSGTIVMFRRVLPYIKKQFMQSAGVVEAINKFQAITKQPEKDKFALRLYRFMAERESNLLVTKINALSHVTAWYSPTAFWPAFNKIKFPRLMCVPDVVLTYFPVSFSLVDGEKLLTNFRELESAINGCQHFVTYSEQIKWGTLVDRYAVPETSVHVVPHAPNIFGLDTGKSQCNINDISDMACRELLQNAMLKSFNTAYTSGFINTSVRFLFYASQFRPSKNVLNLLRAYEYLLRQRFIGHKLILTGNQYVLPEVDIFIRENNLENDVLCLHGLSSHELAACYRLADLSVNPSLSEGGCPFTFTESLSVNTPVVMANIPVTMEVLDGFCLNEVMFFDPYNWRSIADRIEWALNNRQILLDRQRPVYEKLRTRSWNDVVAEYIDILENIAQQLPSSNPM